MVASFFLISASIFNLLRIWMYFNYDNFILGKKKKSLFEIINFSENDKYRFALILAILPLKPIKNFERYAYVVNCIVAYIYFAILFVLYNLYFCNSQFKLD